MKKTRMTKPGVLSAYLFACCMLLAVANANAQT